MWQDSDGSVAKTALSDLSAIQYIGGALEVSMNGNSNKKSNQMADVERATFRALAWFMEGQSML